MNDIEQLVASTLDVLKEAFDLDGEATEKFELLLRRQLMQKYCSPIKLIPFNPIGGTSTSGIYTSPQRTQING